MNRPETGPSGLPLRLLFVCSGNTCRSPLAEVLSRRIGSELGLDSLDVRSAGTHTRSGLGASEGALGAARRHGLSLEEHVSTALSKELVEWADWIFAMGPGHLFRLKELGGEEKAVLLGAYATGGMGERAGAESDHLAVPDPFGGGAEVYEQTFLILERYVTLAMKRLAGEVEE
jgi:protein-tyrosine-phosphatase